MKHIVRRFAFAVASFLTVSVLWPAPICAESPQKVEEKIASPHGLISLTFHLTEGAPAYAVSFQGKPVILSSPLGFLLKEGALNSGFILQNVRRSSKDETWTLPYGEERLVHNHYDELSVTLQQAGPPQRTLRIVFRVFDDAVAFRYEWPEQAGLKQFAIMDELTEFVLPSDPMVLWQPAFRPQASEQLYSHTRLSELLRQTRLPFGDSTAGDNPNRDPVKAVSTPLTMQTDDGLFLVIHEADLTDYAAMELQPRDDSTLKCDLAPWSDGILVKTSAPSVSPWRYVMISDHLSDIVERTSAVSLDLNPPSQIADISWIKPGKFIGIWWGMHLGKFTWYPSKPGEDTPDGLGATTENTRRYIDFAAKYGFSAVLAEGWNKGWAKDWVAHAAEFSFTEPNPQFDLPGLVEYAHARGVDLIAHHETGAVITNYEAQVEAAFAECDRLGIHHVKTGYVGMEPRVKRYDANGNFIGSEYLDGQYMVRHYRKIAILAAKYHIMLDAHEPIKDTGERRTWPNFMSREGARGQEYNAWSPDGGNPPDHDVNLVYTRFLSGPFDFTPGVVQVTYPEFKKNNRVHTTAVKQLAMYVCFYCPLQMAADLPENYEKYRDLFQFLIDVPADWEATRLLNGEIGESVTIARKRRGGEDWYVGSMTNEKGRDFPLSLGFLEPGRKYTAQIYRDADNADWRTNPIAYKIEAQPVTRDSVISMHLAPGGGEAIELKPLATEAKAGLTNKN
jgi:alpha-glucosidase